jgi:hypothetical protein
MVIALNTSRYNLSVVIREISLLLHHSFLLLLLLLFLTFKPKLRGEINVSNMLPTSSSYLLQVPLIYNPILILFIGLYRIQSLSSSELPPP